MNKNLEFILLVLLVLKSLSIEATSIREEKKIFKSSLFSIQKYQELASERFETVFFLSLPFIAFSHAGILSGMSYLQNASIRISTPMAIWGIASTFLVSTAIAWVDYRFVFYGGEEKHEASLHYRF